MERRNFLKSLGILGAIGVTGVGVIKSTKKSVPVLAPFKGKTFIGAGYIYAPYIPLQEEAYKFKE